MFKGWYVCCIGKWKWLCVLDNINHCLRLHLTPVCDAHDRYITRYKDGDLTPEEFDRLLANGHPVDLLPGRRPTVRVTQHGWWTTPNTTTTSTGTTSYLFTSSTHIN